MINDHKTQSEWKIHLKMQINFISSKGFEETHTIHTKSCNIKIMMGNETNEIIEKLFDSFSQKYQEGLEESIRGGEFIRDSVDLLHYHLQKVSSKRGGSYIDSPEWLKNKKTTINPKNNDDNCFQYALTNALNHKQIKSHPERISKIKPFIDQCNLKKIDFPSHSKYRKKFEQNNNRTALNILFVPRHTEEIILAYKSKHNFNRENQVILLMITDGKKWHYLTVKSLSALLKGITSNHKVEFYCLDCFHSYSTKENLQKHEKVCNNHDYCFVEMPNDDNKILKYNYGEKPLKVTAIIYADLECLLEKIHSCQNNPEKCDTEKKN